MKNTLSLASQSRSRKMLLEAAGISHEIIPQSADEYACDWTLPLEQLVASIAVHKMESLTLFDQRQSTVWVLTADTLGADGRGTIYAKPRNHADAVNQIIRQRDQWLRVATAFCLDRKIFNDGMWHTQQRITQTVVSQIFFSIDDAEIDRYITSVDALLCAGSISIDRFGGQYLKEITGSYSSVIGLPLFELQQALKKSAFFN